VQFIRDDELMLPLNRPGYKAWKEEINAKIDRGSRVVICPSYVRYDSKIEEQTVVYHREHCYPPRPRNGVYTVQRVLEKSDYHSRRFVIYHNPQDEVYGNWYQDSHTRKRSIGYYVYERDWWVLNYDRISIDDLDYYIGSRFERDEYLDILPLLYTLRQHRLQEIEWEKNFVKLIGSRLACDEAIVWKAVNWWKFKTLVKRPVTSDEPKALRMIEQKIKQIQKRGE